MAVREETSRGAGNHTSAILAIILLSYLMIVLDISIVITALPKLQSSMHISAVGLSWVQSAYTLAFGSLLLLGARAGDLLGRRRMFLVGIGFFSLASLAVGLAQSAAWLIAARAAQGVGAAILAPSTLALIQTNFAEGRERNRAIGYYAAVAGIGASLGLVAGGVLTSLLSWRVGFFINVPIGLAMLLLTPRFVAETERQSRTSLDVAGALTATVGMSGVVYGIVRSADVGWNDALTLAAVLGGLVLLALFLRIEGRATHPIMPLRLFASRERTGAYLARLLFLGGMLGFWFFTTQYLQNVLGYSALEAGLAFLPTAVPNFFAALWAPRLIQRFGRGAVLLTGLLMAVVGMAWLGHAAPDTSFVTGIALPMVLVGVGQGGVLGPLTAAGIAGVSGRDAGAASGLVNVAHQIGGSLGLSVLVAVFAAISSDGLTGRALLAHRLDAALTGGAVSLFLCLIITAVLIVPSARARPMTAAVPSGATH